MRNGAWSNGSVRASGAVGPEFEPTFCHSLLSGGPWQDLVSSVRLEPLTFYGVAIHLKRGRVIKLFGGHLVTGS